MPRNQTEIEGKLKKLSSIFLTFGNFCAPFLQKFWGLGGGGGGGAPPPPPPARPFLSSSSAIFGELSGCFRSQWFYILWLDGSDFPDDSIYSVSDTNKFTIKDNHRVLCYIWMSFVGGDSHYWISVHISSLNSIIYYALDTIVLSLMSTLSMFSYRLMVWKPFITFFSMRHVALSCISR